MADVPAWTVFAFMHGDDGPMDERRIGVPDWRLDDVLRWCRSRGYDNIFLSREPEPARFERSQSVDQVTHHFS